MSAASDRRAVFSHAYRRRRGDKDEHGAADVRPRRRHIVSEEQNGLHQTIGQDVSGGLGSPGEPVSHSAMGSLSRCKIAGARKWDEEMSLGFTAQKVDRQMRVHYTFGVWRSPVHITRITRVARQPRKSWESLPPPPPCPHWEGGASAFAAEGTANRGSMAACLRRDDQRRDRCRTPRGRCRVRRGSALTASGTTDTAAVTVPKPCGRSRDRGGAASAAGETRPGWTRIHQGPDGRPPMREFHSGRHGRVIVIAEIGVGS